MKPKIGLPHGTLTVKSGSFPRVDVHRWSWLSERQVLLCLGIPLICIIQRVFGGQPNTLNKAAQIKELQLCFFFHRTRNLMVFGSLEWACKFQSAQRSVLGAKLTRSEERRVGKECRCRGSRDY